jgi:hypothetical protein
MNQKKIFLAFALAIFLVACSLVVYALETSSGSTDTIVVEIPKGEIAQDGNWAYKNDVFLRPGLFDNSKFQKIVFTLDGKWIAEIGACWHTVAWPLSSPVDREYYDGTWHANFCYWVNDYHSNDNTDSTGQKKDSMPTSGAPVKIASPKGFVSASLEAWNETYDTDDLIKLTKIKITGLSTTPETGESCTPSPTVQCPAPPAEPSANMNEAIQKMNKKFLSGLGLE